MANKTYAEKLKDPRWQKKRLEIFERDNWICQCCFLNNNKTLHVHHKDYIRGAEPWEYDNSYLLTLCEDCHTELSEKRDEREQQIISALRLKLNGWVDYDLLLWTIEEYDLSRLFCYLAYSIKDKEEIMSLLYSIFRRPTKELLEEQPNG